MIRPAVLLVVKFVYDYGGAINGVFAGFTVPISTTLPSGALNWIHQ
jgi:hypothetical protein